MTHVSSPYSDMQTLAAVEGLQEATQQHQQQQQQQQQQQAQMASIQPQSTGQIRTSNPLVRVISSKLLSHPSNPFLTQHHNQSISVLPAAKVAIIGSQQQQQQHQLPAIAHNNTAANNNNVPYIVTLSNGSLLSNNNNIGNNNNSNNSTANLVNNQFHQMKSTNQIETYQYIDDTHGQIIYQSNEPIQQQNSLYIPQQIFYTNGSNGVLTQDNFLEQHQDSVQQQLTTTTIGNNKTFIFQDRLQDAAEPSFMAGGPRASPATLKWLTENIEEAEGVSLPRSTLYNHYLRHCEQQSQEPMNQASFGKLIRSVFHQIRTRRLGTRGNSKYHYYGIQIKVSSQLNNCDYKMSEDESYDEATKRGFKTVPHLTTINHSSNNSSLVTNNNHNNANNNPQLDGVVIEGAQMARNVGVLGCGTQVFLRDQMSLPNFEKIKVEGDDPLPDGVLMKHLAAYEELYVEQCEAILTGVISYQFNMIETLWKSFWRTDNQNHNELEVTLPRKALYSMSEMSTVQKYTTKSDYVFYQRLVEILIPDVLKPIPSHLTQAIRNFAKNLEGTLRRSMVGVCEKMVESKVVTAKAFAQILRRYTSLNHLAQAARAVLQNPTQVSQMLNDLNRVDFNNIQEQGDSVCGCDAELVKQVELDLKRTLEKQSSLEEWACWLEGVINLILKPLEGHRNFVKIALRFLPNWSYYGLMVIRDLTLRSAASFGSFHLIHLLFDEYMFFLIEKKVAEVSGETPIAFVSSKRKIDDHFKELVSKSHAEMYGSSGSIDSAGDEMMCGGDDVISSVKQEYASSSSSFFLSPTPSCLDDAKDQKKEMDSCDLYFESECVTAAASISIPPPVPAASSGMNEGNKMLSNKLITGINSGSGGQHHLSTSSGKMIVVVPALQSRNQTRTQIQVKRFNPNFNS